MNTEIINLSAWVIITILAIANTLAFVLVGLDKRKSTQDDRRVPEVYFFIWAIFLSSFGVLLGMVVFRHKIRKLAFLFGISLLVIEQVMLVYLLIDQQ